MTKNWINKNWKDGPESWGTIEIADEGISQMSINGNGENRDRFIERRTSQMFPISREYISPHEVYAGDYDEDDGTNQKVYTRLLEQAHASIKALPESCREYLFKSLVTVQINGQRLRNFCNQANFNPCTGKRLQPEAYINVDGTIEENQDVIYLTKLLHSHYRTSLSPVNTSYFTSIVLNELKLFVSRLPQHLSVSRTVLGLKNLFSFEQTYGMATLSNYDCLMNRIVIVLPQKKGLQDSFELLTYSNGKEMCEIVDQDSIINKLEAMTKAIKQHQESMSGLQEHWPYANINLYLQSRSHLKGCSGKDSPFCPVSKVCIGVAGVAVLIFQIPTHNFSAEKDSLQGYGWRDQPEEGLARQTPGYSIHYALKTFILNNSDKIVLYGTDILSDISQLGKMFDCEWNPDENMDKAELNLINSSLFCCEAQVFYEPAKTNMICRLLSITGKSVIKGGAARLMELSDSTSPYSTRGMINFSQSNNNLLLAPIWCYLLQHCQSPTLCCDLVIIARYILDCGFKIDQLHTKTMASLLIGIYTGLGLDPRRATAATGPTTTVINQQLSRLSERNKGDPFKTEREEKTSKFREKFIGNIDKSMATTSLSVLLAQFSLSETETETRE